MRVCAIDVGLKGGLAFAVVDRNDPGTARLESTMPMPIVPVLRRGGLSAFPDFPEIKTLLVDRGVTHLVIEHQQAMRRVFLPRTGKYTAPMGGVVRQGVATTALLMRQFGLCEGLALGMGLPFQLVSPIVWKRAMGLLRENKEASRQRAISLFPDQRHRFGRKLDEGQAEAALIAWWKVTHALDDNRPVIHSISTESRRE